MKVYVLGIQTARQFVTNKKGNEPELFVEEVMALSEIDCRTIAQLSEKEENRLCGCYRNKAFEREFNHNLSGELSPDKVFIRIFAY